MGVDPTFTSNRFRPGITRAGAHNGGALDMRQTHRELGDAARTSPRSRKSDTPFLMLRLLIPRVA
jgi:hypothetical protein